jgi:hypothetical protein
MLDSCEPVHFHSSQCSFPEFPGCFYCDTGNKMYQLALHFHWSCSIVAGLFASAFLCKLILARRVVLDELSSPTTATPAGLICMTLDIVFAGRGIIGQAVVSISAFVHLCLAIWFIYMALAYRKLYSRSQELSEKATTTIVVGRHLLIATCLPNRYESSFCVIQDIMPEPSWFPNSVGIGVSTVKAWLYLAEHDFNVILRSHHHDTTLRFVIHFIIRNIAERSRRSTTRSSV